MKILVDCRCLNYPFLTGVNAYTIRFLNCLNSIKTLHPEMEITAMGFKSARLKSLSQQFGFLNSIFDRSITLAHYHCFIINSDKIHKVLEAKINFKNIFNSSLDNTKIQYYDYVILPQPRLLELNPNSKLITIFHDVYSLLNNDSKFIQSIVFSKKTCQTLVDRSYKIIAGSISTCKDVSKLFLPNSGIFSSSNNNLKLIYPALPDLAQLQSDPTPKSNILETELQIGSQQFILAISGIEPRKNWINILFAHKYLQQHYDYKYNLVLAGSVVDLQHYKSLLILIEKYMIKNVIWKLNPTEFEKNHLLKNCEFLVYPSLYEGFGFPILEAFEFGKTAVTSRISSMTEIGKDACLYVNPFDHLSIANGIWLLCVDKTFKQKVTDNILRNKNNFGWIEMQNELERLLV
jgi:glycosyltransferase involved in cell wall biosynthesis